MKTELQKQFEAQTPTLKKDHGVEYLQTFITWMHFQVEKLQSQLPSAGEEVYVECGKNAQTHYVVSTKAETDMAYIPVRKLTRPTVSEEEAEATLDKIIEGFGRVLTAQEYEKDPDNILYNEWREAAIKELLNR